MRTSLPTHLVLRTARVFAAEIPKAADPRSSSTRRKLPILCTRFPAISITRAACSSSKATRILAPKGYTGPKFDRIQP